MATIREELNQAELVRRALYAPTTIDDAIIALSKAKDVARAQQSVTSLSSEEALNNSRHEVVMTFNDLIRSLQRGVSAPDKTGEAKRAVEDWVKELKALRGVALRRKF
jgi:hypothetical protein